jgi:hypothetical protein
MKNFDHEDRDCVVPKKIALFRTDFSNEMSFCGEFSQKFLGSICAGGHSWAEGVVKRLSAIFGLICEYLS